jgi:hypothetical protein
VKLCAETLQVPGAIGSCPSLALADVERRPVGLTPNWQHRLKSRKIPREPMSPPDNAGKYSASHSVRLGLSFHKTMDLSQFFDNGIKSRFARFQPININTG